VNLRGTANLLCGLGCPSVEVSTEAGQAQTLSGIDMDGLLIKQPFADLSLRARRPGSCGCAPLHSGLMRTSTSSRRRPDWRGGGIAKERLGVAVGIGSYLGTEGPFFTIKQLGRRIDRHRASAGDLRAYAKGRPLYAIVIRGRPIRPTPYRTKPGAVTIIRNVELL
jgi:hypothetical protein